jgi:hypothetical protein
MCEDMLLLDRIKPSMKAIKAVFRILTITTTAFAIQVPAQSFITNGLVAYYPFNGNANDESGNNYNGTVHMALLDADRFERPASCFRFNGLNNYIQLPLNTGSLNGLTQATILAWMKPTLSSNNFGCIFSHSYNGPIARPISFGITFSMVLSNQLWGGLFVGAQSYSVESVATNRWSFVGMVFDGTQLPTNRVRLFMNGKLLSMLVYNSSDIPDHISSLATDTLIGTDCDSCSLDFFHGSLDDIRIYNRALSTNEVQQLYAIESSPRLDLIKAIKPSFSNLITTVNYQLQVSSDMTTWTNQGSVFTATNTSMVYPQYWDVDNWNSLFFRLQAVP